MGKCDRCKVVSLQLRLTRFFTPDTQFRVSTFMTFVFPCDVRFAGLACHETRRPKSPVEGDAENAICARQPTVTSSGTVYRGIYVRNKNCSSAIFRSRTRATCQTSSIVFPGYPASTRISRARDEGSWARGRQPIMIRTHLEPCTERNF